MLPRSVCQRRYTVSASMMGANRRNTTVQMVVMQTGKGDGLPVRLKRQASFDNGA